MIVVEVRMAAENNPLQKAENTPKYKVQSEVAQSCQTVIPWTIAYQAPPSMEFSRQVYWSGLPFPSPGNSYALGLITTQVLVKVSYFKSVHYHF